MPPLARPRTLWRAAARWVARLLLGFLLVSVVAVAALRWFHPPASSFIVQHLVSAWLEGREQVFAYHQWTPWPDISDQLALAVVAAEDQRFPHHHGFDLVELRNALGDYLDTGKLRGASTISQQLAKNLFLWSGRTPIRKGLEAWFTGLLELLLPKRRILELYLNFAQFGPDTYGVGAASRRFFATPAARVSREQASLMAAVLPNPRRYRVASPSSHVRKRAGWIRQQMRNLGAGYLGALRSATTVRWFAPSSG